MKSGQAQALGPLDRRQHLKLAIHLPARNQAGLNDLIQQLYNPASPSYHKYLSVDEFTAQFGPIQADYDAVVSWAKAQGLTVTNTPRNRHLVDVDGSVDDINRALHVTMTSYSHPTEERNAYAPDREPTVNLSVRLDQITGLNNFILPQRKLKKGSLAEIASAATHATGSGPNGVYLPSDMRAVYYGSGPLTGAGQSVGIFSFDGYKASDVQLFYASTGMTSNVPINNVLVNGYSGACDDGGAGCDDGEQVLDIVNVIGMAPGIAQVLFYEGDSGPDILNQMATDNIAKVLSCSWGSGDLGNDDLIFQEFQAQGQTYLNATGDDGAYNSQTWLPPSLNPYVLQIGGTSLTTSGAGGSWVSETGWAFSGGGFFDTTSEGFTPYSIPSYQTITGTVNSPIINDATGGNLGSLSLRNDPDVAAEADFDNPTVSNGEYEDGFGGTSYAAPRWAGFIALANEQALANGGTTLGYVNLNIYSTAVNSTTGFHDVTVGKNKPDLGSGAGFNAVAGYDLVTGWGSPNGQTLIDALSHPLTAPGFVMANYPTRLNLTPGSSATTTTTFSSPNGFTGNVSLSIAGLPSGVTGTLTPTNPNVTTTATLTLTASASATLGEAAITITGTSGTLTQVTTVNVLVGNLPVASVTPGSLAFRTVIVGTPSADLVIADADNSIPLNYSLGTFGSTDGSCSGAAVWLAASVSNGTVNSGQPTQVAISVNPAAGSLAIGDYSGEVCVATNDTTHALIAIPVTLAVVASPALETIFRNGFETGQTAGGGIYTFAVDAPVEDDQAGSALDLVTGNFHTWSSAVLDNINLYDDGSGLQVYWYNDVTPGSIKNKVGGVVLGTDYGLLHSGATIGPASTFSRSISPMTNWYGNVDGYIGVAFRNSATHVLNYGYIHLVTAGANGYPGQILEYAFDNTGAAIAIP